MSGRPEFVPTDDDREKVQVLRAQGMSLEAIAAALDIHHETLRKHFSVELEVAIAKKTADVMMARFRSAMGGSVPAQNKFLELAGAVPPSPKRQAKGPKPGKKEVAQRTGDPRPALVKLLRIGLDHLADMYFGKVRSISNQRRNA